MKNMKHINSIVLAIGLVAGGLVLTGCGGDKGTEADASGAETSTETSAIADMAGKASEAVAALAVVEKPTAAQLEGTKEYALDTCPISAEPLGEMGEPLLLLVGDQQVKLCCKNCLPDLKADPAKIVAQLSK